MHYFFSIPFLVSTLIISLFIVVTLLVKKVFKNHISVGWQYKIWYLLFIILTLPLVPKQYINFDNLFPKISSNLNLYMTDAMKISGSGVATNNLDWINDFALSVSRSSTDVINNNIIFIWIVGVAIFTIIFLSGNYKLNKIKKTYVNIDTNMINILEECKNNVGINVNIQFGKSEYIKTPMIFGLFSPVIIIPNNMAEELSANEIKYVLFHELSHYKNNDILVNYIMCVFQVLYWFNPLVWIAFKQMKVEREMVCDTSVLKLLDEESYIEYGMTIIHFIEKMSMRFNFSTAADMGGTKNQIKKRIEKIASFRNESFGLKLKSILIFSGIFIFALSQTPFISAMTLKDNKSELNKEEIECENLDSYFQGFDGSFVLYDLNDEKYSIYNKEKSLERVSPNSTYKIYSTLFSLENNVISSDNSFMEWNGVNYNIDLWNKNQDLSSAMKNSVTWYFQELDQLTGHNKVKEYLKDMKYGNCDFSGGNNDFWLESTLKISPVEQVDILKDFYLYDMNFEKENIDTVKSAIKLSENNGSELYGKTGTGVVNNKNANGWFVGYVEKEGNVYIFATNIQGDGGAKGSKATEITLSILKDKNIY